MKNNLLERLKKAERDAEYERQRRREIEKKYYKLLNELKKTQALLRQFLNENTPSSKLPFKYPSKEQSETKPKPRGKPVGSNGGTKEVPDPNEIDRKIEARLEKRCQRCRRLINRKEIIRRLRYIYDARIIAEIIEVNEETYLCDCGEFCIGRHPDVPQRGMIGYNLQALFVAMNFVFITIQNSRARRVLTDIFGEDYHGGIISDCFRVYRDFAEWFQKCWVHLLRKAKFEAEKHPKKNIVKLYEQLKILYNELSDFLKENPSKEIRLEKKKEFEEKLNEIINYKNWCKEAKSIIDNWLIAYRGHWLTAIEIEGISLNNNLCERKIRGSIGWRKMLGGHRTAEGAKHYAIIETHRQTWKHQGKYPYNELLNVLKN